MVCITLILILDPVVLPSTGVSAQDEPLGSCAASSSPFVEVSTADELEAALADAKPGSHFFLADGTYEGTFVAEHDGAEDNRIWVCGTRNAVIDGGDFEDGYALHVPADYWTIHVITVTNALKGGDARRCRFHDPQWDRRAFHRPRRRAFPDQ